MRSWWWTTLLCCVLGAGCGTTKWTDSSRTATEQLLISDSMDRAISRLDFRALAGKKIFVDDTPIKGMTDAAYLVSTLRQQILASGGILKEPKDQADYILEVRAGALGTDHHDVLFGIPATTIPTIVTTPGLPTQIPEIPFVKKTDQRAVTKLALFLYNRQTGRPVWQSGTTPEESRAKAVWVFGAGPFQRGSIYRGTKFAGDRLNIPLIDPVREADGASRVAVNDPAFFVEPKEPPGPSAASPAVAKDAASPPKEQTSSGAPGGPAPPSGTAPPGGAAPSSGPAPGVIPAGHTTADKPAAGASQAAALPGATGARAAALVPQWTGGAPGGPAPSGPASAAPAPTGTEPPTGRDANGSRGWREPSPADRVRLLPPVSPFDDPPGPVWPDGG
jgi:hypothetical protein